MNTASFDTFDQGTYVHFCSEAQLERDLNSLYGYLLGIQADADINAEEMARLTSWTSSVKPYENKYPYRVFIEAIQNVLADGVVTDEEIENLRWLCQQYLNKDNPYYCIITSATQQLTGLLTGIAADRIINEAEIHQLNDWLGEHFFLKNTWLFDDLFPLIQKIILNRTITPSLQDELLKICDLVNALPQQEERSNQTMARSLTSPDLQIDIPTFSFCLTGTSKQYTRRQLAELIELYGGYMQDSVSSKLQYLVICDEKSNCWAFASYGRKVEKAIQLKAKGKGPEVIYEEDLHAAIEALKQSSAI
ncbi:hypothetical protein BWI93_23820 [Siphonobacter sp. BAB-5385]|uniref:BRCT domain-containing protein n=1 Tax=Siphonobacter sp. BAB-5385 TaxID=1864822 RepID=UPI000B9EBAF7|nr:BRCT domain-containing protein [Siphonobacter sp. BAB-5385]OZI05720.1 hypothetical protein BWI93_23820 [Siphonobacter sp. BAB-5385]